MKENLVWVSGYNLAAHGELRLWLRMAACVVVQLTLGERVVAFEWKLY